MMSPFLEDRQTFFNTTHHRPPSRPSNPHDNTTRRWTRDISFATLSESSPSSLNYKERRSFSDIPIDSRLPPIHLHRAGARSFHFKPKLPVLEPSTTNMDSTKIFGDFFGDLADQSFTQSDMSKHQSLASPQTYEHHYGSNERTASSPNIDAQSSLFASNSRGPFPPEGQAHSYMPEGNASYQLYQPVLISQSHVGQSNTIYAPTQLYDNFGFMSHNAQNYTPMPQQHVVGTPPLQNKNQAFDSFSSKYNDYELPAPAYNHSTAENTSSSLVGDFGAGFSHMHGSNDSALQTIEHDIEHIKSPSPQVKRRKIAKARSLSSKSCTSAPFSANTSVSPRTKNESGLFYNDFAEAEAVAYNRALPTLLHDDWSEVQKSPTKHVQKLLSAFSDDYAEAPEHFALVKDADKTRWLTYQDGHVEKMSKYDDPTLEAACWVLLKHLIEAHETGMKNLRYHKIEGNITCSEHVNMVAASIRDYAVIRYDVVRLQRLDELVCCTTSAVSRKIANFKGNWNKTERENENQQKAEELGIDYTPVLGDKKRKATDASAASKPARKRVRSIATASNYIVAGPSTTTIKQQRKSSTSSDDIPLQKVTSQHKTIAEMVHGTTDATRTPVLRHSSVRADSDTQTSPVFQQSFLASPYNY